MKLKIPKIPKPPTDKSFNPLALDCPPTDNITTAQIAMVGEAPSIVEVMEKEPFVGPAGSQLNRICAAVQLPRFRIYLTNACKATLPKNNTNKLWTEKGYRCPEWAELQAQLIQELSNFEGKLIILLGATAMRLLIDEPKYDKIGNYRGSIYKAEDFPHLAIPLAGKYIAITYHPASTLARNNPINFYIMIADMKKFLSFDNDPSLMDNKVTILTKPDFNQVMQFYKKVTQHSLVGFDIEATPKYTTCFSLAIEQPDGRIEAMSIPLMSNKGNYWSPLQEVEIWNGLAKILSNPSIGIICQNGMFDITFLLRTMNIITSNFCFDTMLAQHICYTDLPKGLGFLTSTYTYYPYYKDEGKQSHQAAIKDWQMYWEYNAKDSAYLLPIRKKLIEELQDFGATPAMDYVMDLHKPLIEMEFNGILTNQIGIKATKIKYERMIKAMQKGLNKIAGKELNINSPKQMISYFYGELMIKPYVQRSGPGKGRPTCDAVAMSRIARKNKKGSFEAKMIMKIRKYYKLVSTYFNITVDADNKLRCAHKISGTVSGRIATEKTYFGTGANLQNQPTIYKKFLIPEKDYLICEVDLAKAEAHVVAYITQDANMIEAFESGVDVHSFNASKIFTIPIEEVSNSQRYMGKRVVHASNYGMGPQTFSDNLAKDGTFMTQSECKQLLLAYSNRFPGLARWHKQIDYTVSNERILYNLYGRPKRFLGLLNAALFRNAYSYIPQSTVAELLNKGIINMANDPDLGITKHNIDLLTTVHDSTVFQFKVSICDQLPEILTSVQNHLSHTFTHKARSFTIGVDAKLGFQWAGDTVEINKFDKQTVDEALHQLGV